MIVGVVGGGQLGLMLGLAGEPLGIRCRFLDPAPDAPAGRIGELIVGAYDDAARLAELADGADAVTYEFENFPAEAAPVAVRPPARALATSQDRLAEKEVCRSLGIPTAPYAAVGDGDSLAGALAELGTPAVLKTRRLGYDGKGQVRIRDAADAAEARRQLEGRPLLLERHVDFRRELSIIAVRGADGETRFYPLVENVHREGILRVSRAPAAAELHEQAARIAGALLDELGYVGVLAVELFDTGDALLVNELAPRVHNSGHWTIEGATTSQFENHLRAILGLPLGATTPVGRSVMVNLIGEAPPAERLLELTGAHVHLYGKAPRPGRKLGHVTLVDASDQDVGTAVALADEAAGGTTCRGRTIGPVIARYSRPAMARIWSDENKLARWLDVELAALEAWAEVGEIPAEAVAEIRAAAVAPTPERVTEIEARTHHDVAAFVDAVAETLGDHGRWFHYGLTSSDVLDTALALQIREAGAAILEGVDRAFEAVAAQAEAHRETLQIGRTHGIHAEPTTFGLKLAGWAFELDRNRARVERALGGMRVGKLSGAVGTYSATSPEVERIACERLGLEPAPTSTQILQRDRHAGLLAALAIVAASLEKFALEIRHLARTEVGEVQEPFGKGQKGSSAMPHKRNPVVAERICGLARVVRATSTVGLENVALWHERDISHSSAERVVIPDAFLALDYMLDKFAWLMEGLVVRGERMRRNLESSHGLYFSQRLLLALVESGLSRDEAYRLVQRHALRAWDEEQDFRELARADREIAARVDLDAVFDPTAYTRHVDTVFERLRALVRTEETIHA